MATQTTTKRPIDLKRDKALAYFRVQRMLAQRVNALQPTAHGLPDLLLFDPDRDGRDEFDPTLIVDQEEAIRSFCTDQIKWVEKAGRKRPIRMIAEQVRFIAAVFYRRTQSAILWKSRGGGGSFAGSILVWLFLVFRHISWLDLAGSEEQAMAVYKYTLRFWKRFPKLKEALLASEPLKSVTTLRGDVTLTCIPASDKQVRSKHVPGLLVDESCQEDERADKTIHAAINGALSEEDHVVVLLSTFHWPVGAFADTWDEHKERGFDRFCWSIFDTMSPCKEKLSCDTTGDNPCPLTWAEKVEKGDGTVETVLRGCAGQARNSKGWVPYKTVVNIQKKNTGTETFAVEYCNHRPKFQSRIFDADLIELSRIPAVPDVPPPPVMKLNPGTGRTLRAVDAIRLSVGLDWGLQSMMALSLVALMEQKLWVLDFRAFTGRLEDAAADCIREWQGTYRRSIQVFADGSHPFSNARLGQEFSVTAVFFVQWKMWMIANVNAWLRHGSLRIPRQFSLLTSQMKGLRKNRAGAIIKKDDHGPDSLICAAAPFSFQRIHCADDDDETGGDVDVVLFGPNGEELITQKDLIDEDVEDEDAFDDEDYEDSGWDDSPQIEEVM